MWTTLRKLISPLIFLNMASRYRGRSELMKIQAAQAYLTGVQKLRVFYLGCVFVLSALVLMFSGLFLVHTTLLSYSEWSNQTKFMVGLSLGVLELGIAAAVLAYLFKEETWSRFSGAGKVVDCIMKDSIRRKAKGRGNGELN